jgi:hypothetical protein
MSEKPIPCPVCNEEAHSFKVSQIYLESLMRLKHRENTETPTLDKWLGAATDGAGKKFKGVQYYHDIVSKFQPPQAGATVMRSVNPDWVAFGLGLLSIYILYQIFRTQYEIFWYMFGFALLVFALYIIFHKQFIARHNVNKSAETGLKTNVEKGISRWMKLYYCSKDNIVYGDKKGHYVPLDQMNDYLMK